jgi:2-amino-4-hydroxy-6-hydroxymethyldihydropteridine diphosphokinase
VQGVEAPRVAIGLGGNVGDPLFWFRIAARLFAALIDDLQAAPLYRTQPVSGPPQPSFLNTVVMGAARAPAVDLLAVGKALERAAGRTSGPRFGPRPLDVDLLLLDEVVAGGAELVLPHPRLRERRFALAPLVDLEPELRIPPDGRTARELLASLPAEPTVERLGAWL